MSILFKIIHISVCITVVMILSSCINHKNLILLESQRFPPIVSDTTSTTKPLDSTTAGNSRISDALYSKYLHEDYKVKPYDNLNISINDYKGTTVDYFNKSMQGPANVNISNANLYLSSYTVDDSGYVDLPLIGKVYVNGLTVFAIEDTIDQRLSPILKFVKSTVKLANFRVTVLGEVQNPGMYYFYESKVTLMQAIANAGSITLFANTENIRLVRENQTNTEIVKLNLKNPEIITSDYYILQPNDVIYIEPTKAVVRDLNVRTLGLFVSLISVTALVANIVISNNN